MNWYDVLETQVELFRYWQSDEGKRYAAGFAKDVAEKYPDQKVPQPIEEMCLVQASNLYHAEPVHVAPEVQDLVEEAAKTFQLEPLLASDLFTGNAFCLFERPFTQPDRQGKLVSYRAISWIPMNTPDNTRSGIIYSVYTHEDDEDHYSSEYRAYTKKLRERGWSIPKLTLLHSGRWWFDEDARETLTKQYPDEPHSVEIQILGLTVLQTFLRLAQQTVKYHKKLHPPRPTMKRAKRAEHSAPNITVIQLRREASGHKEGEPTPINWSHQWWVRGHWKSQWYPSLGAHRQIYIWPFIKGPEDLPLKPPNLRVFEFTR